MTVKVCSVHLMATFSRKNHNLHILQITWTTRKCSRCEKGKLYSVILDMPCFRQTKILFTLSFMQSIRYMLDYITLHASKFLGYSELNYNLMQYFPSNRISDLLKIYNSTLRLTGLEAEI